MKDKENLPNLFSTARLYRYTTNNAVLCLSRYNIVIYTRFIVDKLLIFAARVKSSIHRTHPNTLTTPDIIAAVAKPRKEGYWRLLVGEAKKRQKKQRG